MSAAIIYGIPNCDTIKKTIAWFKLHKLPFQFYNYKIAGITAKKLNEWSKLADWKLFLNKKGTTWKIISASIGSKEITKTQALKLMQENTSLIKRPVIEVQGQLLIGFHEQELEKQFLNK